MMQTARSWLRFALLCGFVGAVAALGGRACVPEPQTLEVTPDLPAGRGR